MKPVTVEFEVALFKNREEELDDPNYRRQKVRFGLQKGNPVPVDDDQTIEFPEIYGSDVRYWAIMDRHDPKLVLKMFRILPYEVSNMPSTEDPFVEGFRPDDAFR